MSLHQRKNKNNLLQLYNYNNIFTSIKHLTKKRFFELNFKKIFDFFSDYETEI